MRERVIRATRPTKEEGELQYCTNGSVVAVIKTKLSSKVEKETEAKFQTLQTLDTFDFPSSGFGFLLFFFFYFCVCVGGKGGRERETDGT